MKYINDPELTRLYNSVRDIEPKDTDDNYRKLIKYFREYINIYAVHNIEWCEKELKNKM